MGSIRLRRASHVSLLDEKTRSQGTADACRSNRGDHKFVAVAEPLLIYTDRQIIKRECEIKEGRQRPPNVNTDPNIIDELEYQKILNKSVTLDRT